MNQSLLSTALSSCIVAKAKNTQVPIAAAAIVASPAMSPIERWIHTLSITAYLIILALLPTQAAI